MNPSGRVVWITGASSGIGEALALAFAEAGAKVLLSARREAALRDVAARCAGYPERTAVLPLDLADHTDLPGKAEEARDLLGPVDILVHNAGLGQRGLAAETDLDVVKTIMDVNFFGPVALTRAVLPAMLERGAGQIVVVSSVLGKFGAKTRSAYAASKHALHGWFDSLRYETYDAGIRVTLACPGWVKTHISENALEADGSTHGTMDAGQAEGILPDVCARAILRAVRREKDEVTVGGWETWGVLAKRFCPGLLNRVLRSIRMR